MNTIRLAGAVLIGALLVTPTTSFANQPTQIERAKGVELSKATGHWHRSRTYLLAALREYDRGNELVSPDALIDGEEWRSRVLDRIQDLDRVLSPQPRASEGGVRYEPAPELLGVQ